MINHNDIFFTCSLIEFIGRQKKLDRSEVVSQLGKQNISQIYNFASVFHCEPIEKVADDFIKIVNIQNGSFDNISTCKYRVPDFFDIGDTYARLVEDTYIEGELIEDRIITVFNSPCSGWISNYNSDFYYQNRDYIKCCFDENKVLN